MAGPMDGTESAALWQRFRSAARRQPESEAEPDPLLLAAYAENRLPPDQAEAVEDWLATHPDAISDLLAARQADETASPAPSDAILKRAMRLVAAGDASILPFPGRRSAPRLRVMATWGAMAASILVTSLVGFALGNDTYSYLTSAPAPAVSQDLLDPPTGLFYGFDEDQST